MPVCFSEILRKVDIHLLLESEVVIVALVVVVFIIVVITATVEIVIVIFIVIILFGCFIIAVPVVNVVCRMGSLDSCKQA